MQIKDILSSTLGLSEPWQLTDVSFSNDHKRLDITVVYHFTGEHCYPQCDQAASGSGTETRSWFHDNFFSYETYLHWKVPHTGCHQECLQEQLPWSKTGSKFVTFK